MKQEGIAKQVYNIVWPKLSYLKLTLRLSKPATRACLNEIKQQLQTQEFKTEQSKINYIRNWVNTNSIHLIDAEHDSYAFNVPQVLAKLNAHAQNRGKKPHLSCGPRAYVMKAILDAMNIQNRIIDLFGLTETGENSLKVSPHTLIEVYEADTKKWALQDPDFNIAYANTVTHEYQSAEQMLTLKAHEKGYETAGYEIENLLNLQNTVKGLFEWGVLYRYSYEGKYSELILVKDKKRLSQALNNTGISLLSFIKERAYKLNIRSVNK